MNDFWAVMFNKVQLITFPHTVLAAYMTGGAFVVGVALWHLVRQAPGSADHALYRQAARIGATVLIAGGIAVAITGDIQGKIMTDVQPMKMAAAEALYDTESSAGFSLITIGSLDGTEEKFSIKVPNVLSFLATGSPSGEVEGINQLREKYEATYGVDPGATYYSDTWTPIIPVTYWTFRLMIGLGALAALGGVMVLWATRRGRAPTGRWWVWLGISLPLMPLFANSFGWIFSEMGRQPWSVFGLMTTEQAVSPGVSVAEALISLIVLSLVYAALAVVEVKLMLTYIRAGAEPYVEPQGPADPDSTDRPLAFAY